MEKLFNKFFGKGKNLTNKKDDIRSIENIIENENSIGEVNKTEIKFTQDSSNLDNVINVTNKKENIHQSTSSANTKEIQSINAVSDIVIVNSMDNCGKKTEGFYYKKYIESIGELKLSNPILIEREKMKVNFDYEVMDYLVNDMTLIFQENQNKIDNNQKAILKEVEETKELISLLWDIQNDASFNYNMEFHRKQKKFMSETDYLEVIVNTLNSEADNLIIYMDNIESKLGILDHKEQNNKILDEKENKNK